MIDVVLSDDSDICIFGAKKIAQKLDLESGKLKYYDYDQISERLRQELKEDETSSNKIKNQQNDAFLFNQLTYEQKLNCIILMGCD